MKRSVRTRYKVKLKSNKPKAAEKRDTDPIEFVKVIDFIVCSIQLEE